MTITVTRGINGIIPYAAIGSPPIVQMTAAEIEAARATIIVTVADHERYDSGPFDFGDGTAGSLDRVIASLVTIRESIPAEYRDAAFCEFRSQSGYDGDHSPSIEIDYRRPETDEEVIARVSLGRYRATLKELEERAALASLKAKYEPTP